MNLFEINQHTRAIVNNGFSADLETGELLFDESQLNDLENTKAEKFLAIAKMIKEKEAFVKAIKDQEKSMADRRKFIENEVIRLKDWALSNMTEKEKFEDSQIKVSYSKPEKYCFHSFSAIMVSKREIIDSAFPSPPICSNIRPLGLRLFLIPKITGL